MIVALIRSTRGDNLVVLLLIVYAFTAEFWEQNFCYVAGFWTEFMLDAEFWKQNSAIVAELSCCFAFKILNWSCLDVWKQNSDMNAEYYVCCFKFCFEVFEVEQWCYVNEDEFYEIRCIMIKSELNCFLRHVYRFYPKFLWFFVFLK